MRLILALLLLPLAPAQAQDQMFDHGQVIRQDMLTRSLLRQRGLTDRSRLNARSDRARAAATCANLPKARARFGADNPNVRGLERACRQGGYL